MQRFSRCVQDDGQRPARVFHAFFSSSHREWLFAARLLAANHTCYLPDLMGYGETARQIGNSGQVVACRDSDILRAIAGMAGEPVDIVAHSYGAAACLEFALEHAEMVRSFFLVEPVSFQLLGTKGYRSEYDEIHELGRLHYLTLATCRHSRTGTRSCSVLIDILQIETRHTFRVQTSIGAPLSITFKSMFLLGFSAIAYVLGLASLAYLAGFLADFAVPKGINDGEPGTKCRIETRHRRSWNNLQSSAKGIQR